MRLAHLALVVWLPAAVAACATGVSVQDGQGGAAQGGGSGATTATTTTSSESSTTGAGGAGPCVHKEDCAALDDVCNVGTCIDGTCEKMPANENGACDDGLYCTEGDSCQGGQCVGGTAKYCPSPDACHVGVCDEASKSCASAPGNDGASCDDGDPCTYAGACSGGTCQKGPPVDCSVFDSECGIGYCDPILGCQAMPKNDGAACNDGKNDPCTTGVCQAGGCVSVPTPAGTPCDDGLFCTIGDACSNGVCAGEPNTCAPPDNPCMIGTCDEAQKTCVAVPGNDGMPCTDANDCTVGDACSSGACVPGAPGNEGAACDDADGCTSGTTCANGTCANATSTISQCIDGDACCPAGCANDKDCLYWQSGVQQNVAPAALTGWTQCWSSKYGESGASLATVLAQCSKPKLLMACRKVGDPTYELLAMAPRADVLFDCGSQQNCTKQSNGVGWYYSDSYSWGFAPGGLSVSRNSCDYGQGLEVSPELRLCWHTSVGQMSGGFRCGDNSNEPNFWLNSALDWERVVYQAD